MASSQNEFIVGCLIGGLVGAATALLLPKKFLNEFMPMEHQFSNHTYARRHANRTSHERLHAHSKAHVQAASKSEPAMKKTMPKKAAKRKTSTS